MEIPLRAADEDAFAADHLVIGAQVKMNFVSCVSQFAAVEASHGAAPNHCYFHTEWAIKMKPPAGYTQRSVDSFREELTSRRTNHATKKAL